MRITLHSDYSLRVLIFLATRRAELATIPQIAAAYGISRTHLTKVVQELGRLGYVDTLRGRNGGLALARPPEDIRIGEVLRNTEESLSLVECFAAPVEGQGCRIDGACRLKGVLAEALDAFLAVLDRYTLADLVQGRAAPLRRLLTLA